MTALAGVRVTVGGKCSFFDAWFDGEGVRLILLLPKVVLASSLGELGLLLGLCVCVRERERERSSVFSTFSDTTT